MPRLREPINKNLMTKHVSRALTTDIVSRPQEPSSAHNKEILKKIINNVKANNGHTVPRPQEISSTNKKVHEKMINNVKANGSDTVPRSRSPVRIRSTSRPCQALS